MDVMNKTLEEILASLPRDFFGNVEIIYQWGRPGHVRVTTSYKLPDNQIGKSESPRTQNAKVAKQ